MVTGLHEDLRRFVERGRFRQGAHIELHGFTNRDRLHDFNIPSAVEANSMTRKSQGVDGVFLNPLRDQETDRHSEHQRQDDAVIVGHLEQQDDGGQRRVDGTSQYRCHAYKGKRGRTDVQPREQIHGDDAKSAAEGCANEKGRCENAAVESAANADRCQDQFCEQ